MITYAVDTDATLIHLFGRTFTSRREIEARGGKWDADNKCWSLPYGDANLAYAKSLASPAAEAKPMFTPPTPEAVLPGQQEPTPKAKRTVRDNAPPDAPEQAQGDVTPDALALAKMLQSMLATQQQQAPVDASAVKAIAQQAIAEALKPLQAQLDARPPTQLVITQGDVTRTVDGLRHAMLPDLIRCLSAGLHVWIAGPSGSGKTHAAEQAAHALGLPFALHGAMTMAHELTGFVDANGKYHETPFVRTFRNGGVILLDELDAGSNEALLALNAALANGIMSLPNGEVLRVHADFKCIGGANTFGAGATSEYVGRTRIDAAFLQRFGARLFWTYDEKLETAMSGNPAWSTRVQQARKKAATLGLKVLITPRASQAGAKLIAAGFTPDQAANMTYLADLTPAQRKQMDG